MRNSGKVHAWIGFLLTVSPIALIGYGSALCIWAITLGLVVLALSLPWYGTTLVLLLSLFTCVGGACVWVGANEAMKADRRRTDGGVL